jgi:hypothetical protein
VIYFILLIDISVAMKEIINMTLFVIYNNNDESADQRVLKYL